MSSPSQRPPQNTSLTHFSHSVWYTLALWPALTLAVTSSWGGPDSAGKRDWLAASIVELFEDDHETEACDVEARLLQVMLDEFEVAVDDGSAGEVAEEIVGLWPECGRGEFAGCERLRLRWEKKQAGGGTGAEGFKEVEAGDRETDGDGEESGDEESEDGDVEMGEAPEGVRIPREKVGPQMDEEGFTTVVKRRR